MALVESSHHLPDHGEITVVEDRLPDGVVAYRVSGPDLGGTIAFKPDVRDDQPVPDRVVVQLGDGDHLLATHLDDLSVAAGITLIGGASVDLDDPSWSERLRLSPRRPADRGTPAARSAVGAIVAVCELLARRYRMLDRRVLMRAAARHTAGARLVRWVHGQVLPHHRLLAETHEALAAAYRLTHALQQLSALPLAPAPPTRRCTGNRPVVDPETYVSADDDGDWLTCPRCHRATVMIAPGDSLAGLLCAHAAHTCPPTTAG